MRTPYLSCLLESSFFCRLVPPLLAGDFQIFRRPTAGIPSLKNWQRQPTAPRMRGSKAVGQGEGRRSDGFWKAENPTLIPFNTIIYNKKKHKSKRWIFCRLSQPKVAREFVDLLPMGSWMELLISSPRPAGECPGTDSAAGEGGIWSHLRWGLGSDFFGMDQTHEIRMMKGVLFWVLTFGLFSSCTKGTALKEMKGEWVSKESPQRTTSGILFDSSEVCWKLQNVPKPGGKRWQEQMQVTLVKISGWWMLQLF